MGQQLWHIKVKSRPSSGFLRFISSQLHPLICILSVAVAAEMSNRRATWLADFKTLTVWLFTGRLADMQSDKMTCEGLDEKRNRSKLSRVPEPGWVTPSILCRQAVWPKADQPKVSYLEWADSIPGLWITAYIHSYAESTRQELANYRVKNPEKWRNLKLQLLYSSNWHLRHFSTTVFICKKYRCYH